VHKLFVGLILPLGALSSHSAPSVLVGARFKKFGLFLNTGVFSDYVWTSSVTMNFPERMILRRITGREELGHGTLLSQYSVRQNTGAAVLPTTVRSLETMS
jgi:hypothetical protein